MLEVINFYKFFDVADPRALGERWLGLAARNDLKGTLLLAPEGTNSTLAGESPALDAFLREIEPDCSLEDVIIKRMPVAKLPLPKLKLKVKPEIVTTGWNADWKANQGTFVSPKQFREMLDDPEVVVIDTRNDYEYYVGTFRGARVLPLNEFDQFEETLPALEDLRDRKIVTFCTGGIRCEKAVPLLKKKGFERVYQLQGGILNYFEELGGDDWEGECFVFDYRCSIKPDLSRGTFQFCESCGQPTRQGLCTECNAASYQPAFDGRRLEKGRHQDGSAGS
ncbi:MAG: hypothetical protein H7A21_03520 [Spirochaetales bacterium]|nr:hypothetical protein [Leptospiraceae bacterium]MCP5480479.1 hypothetical protein [Spirochaetales bacterium]